jgi:diaminohydroxyphosphoribosylaminopyrimidine deaminase / 5-amino-6-(5-phosphoribosylamino)uracil reductase
MLPKQRLDELFMLECLALAEKGAGYVSPNPMVGAVLVKNQKVIARGHHKQFGGSHAEVNAIRAAGKAARGSTLYVNLEPCNFYGKTPPCTKFIVSAGISEVIVGMRDPNPLVAGKGIQELRRAGIIAKVGILEDECTKFNEVFSKFITTKMPFVTLKVAQTLDGKIADVLGNSKWITNRTSRKFAHRLRSRYDAILVGAETILKDNSRLTVREVEGRNPIRAILDGRFRINPDAIVYSTSSTAKTLIFTSYQFSENQNQKKNKLISRGIEIIELPGSKGKVSLNRVLRHLAEKGVASILVEGGAKTFSEFLEEKLVDKIELFISPKILGKGLDSFSQLKTRLLGKAFHLHDISVRDFKSDILIEGYLHK